MIPRQGRRLPKEFENRLLGPTKLSSRMTGTFAATNLVPRRPLCGICIGMFLNR
jgi:hypothetical protein